MLLESADSPRTACDAAFRFAQESQLAVGRWCVAPDLASQLEAGWDLLACVPTYSRETSTVVVPIVLAVANRLRTPAAGLPRCETQRATRFTSPTRVKVVRALAFLLGNYRTVNLGLRTVADHAGVSSCYLSRVLVSETRYGFETHLHGIRVLMAGLLLRDTTEPIALVGMAVGYSSTVNFGRRFRERMHMSPTEFRLL